MFKVEEKYRVVGGMMGSTAQDGNNGAFYIPIKDEILVVIASDGADWEHVSVSHKDRCPTWEEMSIIKSMFWDDEDCVVQYHPPKSEYVDLHKTCLHLWRSINQEMPRPPACLIGLL